MSEVYSGCAVRATDAVEKLMLGGGVGGLTTYEAIAEAALLAALDPEDSAMVEAMARAMLSKALQESSPAFRAQAIEAYCGKARAAIAALRAQCSQGEQND